MRFSTVQLASRFVVGSTHLQRRGVLQEKATQDQVLSLMKQRSQSKEVCYDSEIQHSSVSSTFVTCKLTSNKQQPFRNEATPNQVLDLSKQKRELKEGCCASETQHSSTVSTLCWWFNSTQWNVDTLGMKSHKIKS